MTAWLSGDDSLAALVVTASQVVLVMTAWLSGGDRLAEWW